MLQILTLSILYVISLFPDSTYVHVASLAILWYKILWLYNTDLNQLGTQLLLPDSYDHILSWNYSYDKQIPNKPKVGIKLI